MTLLRLDTNFNASQSAAGLMSAADKKKLDGVEDGAQKNVVRGVKGNAESTYRVGNVSLGPANIGAAPTSHSHSELALQYGGTVYENSACRVHIHTGMNSNKGAQFTFEEDGSIYRRKTTNGGSTWSSWEKLH